MPDPLAAPLRRLFGSLLRWTSDGQALLVNDYERDRFNVWRSPFQGEPKRLTSFSDLATYAFAVSADG